MNIEDFIDEAIAGDMDLTGYTYVVFTDGACSSNGKSKATAASASIIQVGDYKVTIAHKLPTTSYARYTEDMNTMQTSAPKEFPEWRCSECPSIATYVREDGTEWCSKCKKSTDKFRYKWECYKPTNIRAEGLAILYALLGVQVINYKKISESRDITDVFYTIVSKQHAWVQAKSPVYGVSPKSSNQHDTKVVIVTDSQFWIDVVTKWSKGWIAKKSIHEKKNADIVHHIMTALSYLDSRKIQVDFKFVRGHQSGNNALEIGNIEADGVAVEACKSANSQIYLNVNHLA